MKNNPREILRTAFRSKDLEFKKLALENYRRSKLCWNYATKYHLNTHGQKLTFKQRPYLVGLYNDQSNQIVVKKSVQCGISEWAICDAFSNAESGLNILYVLPKYALRNRFVKRINKVITRSKYYKDQIGENDSLWQKTYNGSEIVFASSETDSDFIEFPADEFIIDELDFCDQENILLAPDRISASNYGYQRVISTPTHEDFGIDQRYKESDQKEWNIKCDHCNENQELDFFENVVRSIGENVYELIDQEWNEIKNKRDINVYCRKCKKEINRFSEGSWISKNGSNGISGYHISKLITPNILISDLWKTYQKAQSNASLLRRFYNSDLGLSYTVEGDRLTRPSLIKCRSDHVMIQAKEEIDQNKKGEGQYGKYYMGVDVGNLIHVVIKDQSNKIVLIKTVGSFNDCSQIMNNFDVRSCVVDIRPETRKVREFQNDHKDKVLLCEYIDSNITKEEIFKVDRKEGVIQAHRTQSIDQMIADILQLKIKLPKDTPRDFFDQMTKPVRILEETKKGPEARWTKGNDHYFHALNYCNIAQRINKPLLYDF